MSASSSRTSSPGPAARTSSGVINEKVPHTDTRNSGDAVATTSTAVTPPADAPFSHGFFDKDERSVQARMGYIKAVVAFTVMTWLIIWGVVSIYWGAFWKGRTGTHNLHGWIVDFDGGSVGQAVSQAFVAATGPKDQMTWVIRDPQDFPNGMADVEKAVGESHPWAAVAIRNGATSSLGSAIQSADASYDPSSAITAFGNQARNENAYNSIIQPSIVAILSQVTQKFAAQQAAQLASGNAQALPTILSRAPRLITQPIFYTIVNTHPFDIPVATAVTFVGLIYLLVISFIIVNATTGVRANTGLERRLTTGALIRLRVTTYVTLFFFMSLAFSLISLFFQVPFNRHFGHAGFFIYWMLSFLGMTALGLALDAMLLLVTIRFIGFFMIFFIITNVSVSALPVEVQPTIFRYGRAMPFYNVNQGVRTILFGTANHLGQNFGILIAWAAVSLITIPLFQFLQRRPLVREMQQKAQGSPTGAAGQA